MHFHDANILHPGKLTAGSPENQPVETGKNHLKIGTPSFFFGVPRCDFSQGCTNLFFFFSFGIFRLLLSMAARLSHCRKPIILWWRRWWIHQKRVGRHGAFASASECKKQVQGGGNREIRRNFPKSSHWMFLVNSSWDVWVFSWWFLRDWFGFFWSDILFKETTAWFWFKCYLLTYLCLIWYKFSRPWTSWWTWATCRL